jgi:hypothetical protein
LAYRFKHFSSNVCNLYTCNYRGFNVGFSNGSIPEYALFDAAPNSYTIREFTNFCFLSGKTYHFELPKGAIQPKWKQSNNVAGCGLLLSSTNELSIFFTLNGILMGQ